ncbi:MAG: glycosyltransferase family 9 protein [Alphaproteobacteria bacterium]|nr:glycosyltransferase family 9 protein [Alphaproteobacteria bacterium]
MRILFITSTRLGDAVLSTGILDHMIRRYSGADITVACGPLVEGIFKTIPEVSRVIALKKQKYWGHWFKLAQMTALTRWDIVIDLRNSIYTRLLPARKKYIWGQHDQTRHKVEQCAEVIGANPPPAPHLWFDDVTLEKAERLVPGGGMPVLGIGPAANWPAKTWPAENFIALIQRITMDDGFMPDARIAIFAAPGEEEVAYQVLKAFPDDRQIDVIAKADPLTAAAALKRCQFFIGNDSGLMHCAAAVGTPTLGLFGPSWPYLYAPWGAHCSYVSTPEDFDELTSYKGYTPQTAPCLMASLTVDAAYKGASHLWQQVAHV